MALINLRNALMAGKKLPYDNEVEFLESTGTQYINTGIMGASEWHITAQGATTPRTSNCVIATTSLGGSFFGNYGAIDYWAVGNGSSWRCSLPYTSIGSFIVTFSASSVQFTVNGETVTRLSAPNFSKTFYLFSTNGEGFGATVRVYGCKVYQNNVLVRDYIPVRKGTVGYLYDRVSGALFGNAGTGDFVRGQDVVPVEWLGSDGGQWVDSGITEASSIQVEWMWMTGNDVKPFGANISGLKSSNFCIYNGRYRATNITLSKEEWQTVTMDNVNGTLTVKQGNAEFTANSWFKVTTPSTNGRIVPIFGASHNDGTLYDGIRISTSGGKRFRRCTAIYNGVVVKNDIPVRVGSGTTWEGAMMDVLTRRIYRNAGTGAFTYGNDLKYPISAS